MNLTKDNYVDYFAAEYFRLANCANMKFEFNQVKMKNGAVVPVLHLSGINQADASVIDVDLWPRSNVPASQLKTLPKVIQDFQFRIGYATTKNEKGETVIRESTPKVLGYYKSDGMFVKWAGKKHEWDETEGAFEPWTNEEPASDEESQE